MRLLIKSDNALIGERFRPATLNVEVSSGLIVEINGGTAAERVLDGRGLTLLPGIVDIHGDAFERQIMPRPGVDFPIDVALRDSDKQAIGNGITTVFHGVTWSWEPGLRGPENVRAIAAAIGTLRHSFQADTRLHLRHEIYNLEAEREIARWLETGCIDVLAFNDHLPLALAAQDKPQKFATMVQRSGVSGEAFLDRVAAVQRRANQVPASIERLAETARSNKVPLLSHDDAEPEQRRWFRALGCRIAEFPTTRETARDAIEGGDAVVFGAPNVVRGGSHTGWVKAADMVAEGLCTVLASDYYYPALLLAAFRLAYDGVAPLARTWPLVSEHPAKAVGLLDRGRIEAGRRADLILVDAADPSRPRLAATIANGRIVYLDDISRLQ
jgi:alpha-D-ribose 1-methylphosphonate 5-triphosphate diphosphatase